MFSYSGHILQVDLSDHTISSIPIDRALASKFLGGSGYASRLLFDLLNPDADPLGPENMLFFMTGPLTGTLAPCTGRHVVCGKSPITGLWGESHSGGHFGVRLRASGYDGIMITGRSNTPVTLEVNDREASILSADHLWGLPTDETQEILQKGHRRLQVVCIGPAGENLVKFASIVSGERVAARCGLGAVMGSKKLKAITVNGINDLELSSPDKFKELALASSKALGQSMELLRDQGTAMYIDIGMMFNDMPIRYFQDTEFDVDSINGSALKSLLTGRNACYSCPIGCGRRVSLPEMNMINIAGPEYQTIASFGSNLLISDLKQIVLMNHLCNQYGLDTVSCGSTIALAMYLHELGKADYGLRWGDADFVIDTIHKIARREGIGRILAEGSLALGGKHNAQDLVLHVRGLEIPNHDPRAFFGMATIYAIASRGATHLEGDMYSIDMGTDVQELGIVGSDRLRNEGKGVTAARSQDYRAFFDCVIMCHFANVPTLDIVTLLNLATGFSLTTEDILTIGSRAVTMKRLFNLKCGLKTTDEVLPNALVTPHPESVTAEYTPHVDMQLDEYYDYRKWDRESGKPTKETLDSLDIVID